MIQTKQVKFDTPAWDFLASRMKSDSADPGAFSSLFDTAKLQYAQNNSHVDSAKSNNRRERVDAVLQQPKKTKTDRPDPAELDSDPAVESAETPIDTQTPVNESTPENTTDQPNAENQTDQNAETPADTTQTASQNTDLNANPQNAASLPAEQQQPSDDMPETAKQINPLQGQADRKNEVHNPDTQLKDQADIKTAADTEQTPADTRNKNVAVVNKETKTTPVIANASDVKPDSQKQNPNTQTEIPVSQNTDENLDITLQKDNTLDQTASDLPKQHNDAQNKPNHDSPVELAVENNKTADPSKIQPDAAIADQPQKNLQNKNTKKQENQQPLTPVAVKTISESVPEPDKTIKSNNHAVIHATDISHKTKVQTATPEKNTKVENPSTVNAQQNVDRVVKAATSAVRGGNARVQIRLDPPDLGSLRIDIRQNAQGMQLQLQATNVRAQQILQQNVNELKAALQAQGVNTTQIDIQLRLDLKNEASAQQQQGNPNSASQNQQDPGAQSFQSMFSQQDYPEEAQQPFDPELDFNDPVSTPDPKTNTQNQWQELSFNKVNVLI